MAARRRPWKRYVLATAVIGGAVGVLGVAGVVWWLTTPGGNEFLRRRLEAQVDGRMKEGDFAIGKLTTDVFGCAELEDVRLSDGTGKVLVGARWMRLCYSPIPLLGKRVQLNSVEVDGAVVDLTSDSQGLLDIQRVFGQTAPAPKTNEPWAGLPIDFDADRLRVHGADVRVRTPSKDYHFVGVDLVGAAHGAATKVELDDMALQSLVSSPISTSLVAYGSIAYTGDGVDLDRFRLYLGTSAITGDGSVNDLSTGGSYDLTLGFSPLDLAELDRFLGGDTGLYGKIAGSVTLAGPANAVHAVGKADGVDGTRGGVDLDLTVDTKTDGTPYTGTVVARGLHVEDVESKVTVQVGLNGTLVGQGHGLSWPGDFHLAGHYSGGVNDLRDVHFESLDGDVAIDDGIVRWSNVATTGPLGALGVRGEVDTIRGGLSTDVTGPVTLEGLQTLNIPDVGGRGSVTVHVEGNVLATNLPLRATGTARLAPFTYTKDVRFDEVVARFAWRQEGPDQHVDVDADGRNGVAYDLRMATVHAPGVSVDLFGNGEKHVVGKDAHVTGLVYPLSVPVTADAADVDYDVVLPPNDGPRHVVSDIRLGAHAIGDFVATDGVAHVTVDGDDVAFDVHSKAGERDFLVTRGTFGLVSRDVDLASLEFSPTPRQRWVAKDETRLTLTDGGLANAHLDLASDLGEIQFDGTAGTVGPLDGHLVTEHLQLDTFAELDPDRFAGLAGDASLDVVLKETAQDPHISGAVDARGVWIPGFSRWLDVTGTFQAADARGQVHLDVGAAGEPLATVRGAIPFVLDLSNPRLDAEGPIDVDVALREGSLDRLEWLTERDLGLPPGRISGVLQARGRAGDPDFTARGVTELAVRGWEDRGRVEFDVERKGADLSWWADLREGFTPRGEVSGHGVTRIGDVIAWAVGDGPEPDLSDYTLYVDQMDGRVVSLGVPIESLLAATGEKYDLSGQILGGFTVKGSPMKPEIAGGINVDQAKIADVPLTGAYLGLTPAERGFQLDSYVGFEEDGGTLTVSGAVPIVVDLSKPTSEWSAGDLGLTVGGEGIPLAIATAFTDQITAASGKVDVAGQIGGAVATPHPQLHASLKDGRIESGPLDVVASDVRANVAVDEHGIDVSAHAHTEPLQSIQLAGNLLGGQRSNIDVAAGVDLQDWSLGPIHGQVKLDQALLIYTVDQVLRTSGTLTFGGRWPAVHVAGGLKVDEGRWAYNENRIAGESPFEIDPAITIHRGESAPSLAAAEGPAEPDAPPWYSDFDVDVSVDLNRAFVFEASLPLASSFGTLGAQLSTAQLTARLGGRDMQIRMTNGELGFYHTVDVVEGEVSAFQGNFDISGGQATFNGDPSEPILDITGTMRVTGGTIEVGVHGRPEDRDLLSFRSEEYPDQTEIFTILLTGKSPEDLASSATGTAANVLGLAYGLAINAALGSVQTHAISVDPDGTIKISVPSLRDLRLDFGVDPTPTPDENTRTIEGEYTGIPDVVVTGTYGDEHSYADIFWELKF